MFQDLLFKIVFFDTRYIRFQTVNRLRGGQGQPPPGQGHRGRGRPRKARRGHGGGRTHHLGHDVGVGTAWDVGRLRLGQTNFKKNGENPKLREAKNDFRNKK